MPTDSLDERIELMRGEYPLVIPRAGGGRYTAEEIKAKALALGLDVMAAEVLMIRQEVEGRP